jgi:hypothetical protein
MPDPDMFDENKSLEELEKTLSASRGYTLPIDAKI